MDFLAAALPLLLLVFLTTKKQGMPAHYALPLVAVLLYLLQLFYFHQDFAPVHASVIAGFLSAGTPLMILWGAVFFFKTLEAAGSLALVKTWLNNISPHPVAQLMLIGWSFSFFVEGISGFGTPAVMAAPLLVSLGFDPLKVVILCLTLNTIPVSFGAVGTPMWFGFGELNLSKAVLREVSVKTAFLQSSAALVIPVLALCVVLPWKLIRQNLIFIYSCLIATMIPYTILAFFNTEFPAIAGGLSGLITAVFLARKKVGLSVPKERATLSSEKKFFIRDYLYAFFPFAGVIGLLAATRFKPLGLQGWLTSGNPLASFTLFQGGELHISSSFVLKIKNILGTGIDWEHALLYVPSLIPFIAVSLICFLIFRLSVQQTAFVLKESWRRLLTPFFALLGAMIFVKLFMLGGERAPAILLGYGLAKLAGDVWSFVAVYLGALGSFFAGSCTISNLTFGPVQSSVAAQIGADLPVILSLQSVGGAMGNMVCIHNIVAVCAVLGLQRQEGLILRKTFVFVFVYGLIAATASLLLNGAAA